MHYTERDRRLREILLAYGLGQMPPGDDGLWFAGLHSAIEELMDEDRADAYEEGMAVERISYEF